MNLGLIRRELGQDATKTLRLLAELRTHPVVTGRSRVALVEDQIQDLEHGLETLTELRPARNLEGNPLLGQQSFGSHDALGDGRLGYQEDPRDLLARQAAHQAQRQRKACFGGKHRMASREHEA